MGYLQHYSDRIVDEAAEWFARIHDPQADAQTRADFAQWLCASSEHVREYLQLAMLHADVSELPSGGTADEMIKALQAGGVENIVPLTSRPVDAAAATGGLAQLRSTYGRVARRVALAASIVVVLAAGYAGWQHFATPTYRTGVGEQKSFPLPDGSLVTLNAVSELQVHFSRRLRDLRLVSGEALFDVAKNPQRPFRVRTDDAVIRAIGTRFNVQRRGQDTTVTVVEGTVEVQSTVDSAADPGPEHAARRSPVRLTQGQRVRIESQAAAVSVSAADVQSDLAWRERRLIFEARTLGAAVDEFNLYNDVRIVVEQERLRAVEVSGAFYANDPRSFALFLQEAGLARAVAARGGDILLLPPQEGR